MKGSGIWIDSKKAWIMRLDGEKEHFLIETSGVEDTHPGGGYGGEVPYGPQIASPENKILFRRDLILKKFFDRVIDKVGKPDRILIEGPAEAKLGLFKRVEDNHELNKIEVEVRAADKKTENQFKASVRDYFNSKK
nr:hypothetical protein [uncultured bacterium]